MVPFLVSLFFLRRSFMYFFFRIGMGMMAAGGGGRGGYGMQGHFNPAFMQGQGGQYPQAKRFRTDDGV